MLWRVRMSTNDYAETVQGGASEDLRLCGLPGDDEEDLRDDCDALFGHSVEDPINVEDHPACGADDGNNGKRSRPSTSPVWDDFEKLFKVVNGKTIRYAAKCLHCSKHYSALSSGGTGHLTRHRDACPKRLEKTRMSQSQISFNPDGSMRNWD